jgi:CBS domain-containing protein
MQARDIMTRQVITIGPDATVDELAELLTSQRISGVPVMDSSDRLVGVATDADVISKAGERVGDIMTPHPITVREEAPLEEVAMILAGHHIKRVPVMRGDALVGLVSRADIVKAVARRTWRPDHILDYELSIA